MHHSWLCDSTKKNYSKPLSQVTSKNVFGQLVCGVFLNFQYVENYLKTHVLQDH